METESHSLFLLQVIVVQGKVGERGASLVQMLTSRSVLLKKLQVAMPHFYNLQGI